MGLGSFRQPPFVVLQCCGEAHEPTSPSHDLFPLCKEEKIRTRTGMFIYFGRVCCTHYLHLKLWDFYLAQYKNNNNNQKKPHDKSKNPTRNQNPPRAEAVSLANEAFHSSWLQEAQEYLSTECQKLPVTCAGPQGTRGSHPCSHPEGS